MAHKIKWSPRAASALESICDYLSRDSEVYAAYFAKKVVKIVTTIPNFPKAGRIVPEFQDENLRERFFNNYRVVYRLNGELIEIVAICHSAQLVERQIN